MGDQSGSPTDKKGGEPLHSRRSWISIAENHNFNPQPSLLCCRHFSRSSSHLATTASSIVATSTTLLWQNVWTEASKTSSVFSPSTLSTIECVQTFQLIFSLKATLSEETSPSSFQPGERPTNSAPVLFAHFIIFFPFFEICYCF